MGHSSEKSKEKLVWSQIADHYVTDLEEGREVLRG